MAAKAKGAKVGTPVSFYELVQTFGWPIGTLLFAVICQHFDVVVSGARYRKVVRERDQLFRLALSTTRGAQRNANVAERALAIVDHREPEADDDDDRSD
jgi:hypothetical protein